MEVPSPANDLVHDSSRGEPDHTDGHEDEHLKRARVLLSNMTSPQLRLVVYVIQGLMNTMNPVGRRKQNLLESINETLRMSAHFAIDAINLVTRAVNGEEDDDDDDEDDDDDDDEQTKLLQNEDSGNIAGEDDDEDNDHDEDDVEEEIEIDEDDDDDADEETNTPMIPDEQKGFEDDDDDDEDVDVDRDLDVIDDAPGDDDDDDDDDDDIDIEVQEHGTTVAGSAMEEDEDEGQSHAHSVPGAQEQQGDLDDEEELIEEDDDEEEDLGADTDAEASRHVDAGVALPTTNGDDEDLQEPDDGDVRLDFENMGSVDVMDTGAGNGANLDSNLNVVGETDEVPGEEDVETDDQTEAGRRKRKRGLFDAAEQPPLRQVRRLP